MNTMTDLTPNQRIDALLIASLGCAAADIQPEKALVADLLADSMALMDIAMALETEFGVVMDEQKMEGMNNVADLYRMIASAH